MKSDVLHIMKLPGVRVTEAGLYWRLDKFEIFWRVLTIFRSVGPTCNSRTTYKQKLIYFISDTRTTLVAIRGGFIRDTS